MGFKPDDSTIQTPSKRSRFRPDGIPEASTQKPNRPELGDAIAMAVGGPAGALFAKPEYLPATGQAVGGVFGGMPGAVGGATIGEVGKQSVEFLKGDRPNLDPKEMLKTAGVTGLVEGLTRGTGRVFFRKQIANETLNKLGQQLGQMKTAMSDNPALKATSKPILDLLDTGYSSLPEPLRRGKTASVIRKWSNYLKGKAELSAKDLILMEDDLGKAATYGEYTKGVFQPATDIPNPAMNRLAKTGRSQVSKIVDDLAEKGGQKGFKTTSQKVSKLLEKFPEFDPTKQYGGFGQRLVTSSMAGMATGNPLIGAGTYVAQRAIQSPEVRNALFKITKNKAARAVGTGAKLTLSDLARRTK